MSEQEKGGSSNVKHGEEKNIPWSQQVDEALFDNSSPLHDDTTGSNQGSVQFQYPPFNVKDTQSFNWHSKNKKPSSNFNANKKYGKPPSFHGIIKRTDDYPNAWDTHNPRKIMDNAEYVSKNYGADNGDKYTKLDSRTAGTSAYIEEKPITKTTAQKKTTWASIASQPAKVTSKVSLTPSNIKKKGPGMPPPPMVPGKHNFDVNTWDSPNSNPPPVPSPPPPPQAISPNKQLNFNIMQTPRDEKFSRDAEVFDDSNTKMNNASNRTRNITNGPLRKNGFAPPVHQNRRPGFPVNSSNSISRNENLNTGPTNRLSERRFHGVNRYDTNNAEQERGEVNTSNANNEETATETTQAMLEVLCDKNNYNPAQIDLETATLARFFVIKSYSEDDIHRSIKYEIWCSTDHGNKRLDDAFKERQNEGGNILLFFSVNGSGHFCGMAQMMTAVDYNSTSSVWSQDKWKGKFKVKWIYVKDVPNNKLRHIHLENNDNKPVTNSRDTQEVPRQQGIQVLQILHAYEHSTSIFDDFYHYEKKQEVEVSSKKPLPNDNAGPYHNQISGIRAFNRQNDDRDKESESRMNNSQKYFGGLAGSSYRDRNNGQRSGYYNNYNERRFDNNKPNSDYQYSKHIHKDQEANRENNDHSFRNTQKYDYNRREDRQYTRHNNRD